ncbi:MAG: hypothetical protein FJW53_01490 [Actinobacteria bacterium]|nr:hypothetical protein [Actinomycetota bacterium]
MNRNDPSRRPRRFDRHAAAAFVPLVALVPAWLAAIWPLWWVVDSVRPVSYAVFAASMLAAGTLLFVRPIQRLVLTRLLGARAPTITEAVVLGRAWRPVAQATHVPVSRYVLAVVDSDELNAFASGGHLVIVSSWAVENLAHDELCGVLAHELSHHLGMHTVALTIGQWLTLPIVLLARIGLLLQNIADAAAGTLTERSSAGDLAGRTIAGLLTIVSWIFLAAITVSQQLGNILGKGAEFTADESVIAMGFGRELRSALAIVVADGRGERARGWRERMLTAHPPARTRIARIDAQLRASTRRPRSG